MRKKQIIAFIESNSTDHLLRVKTLLLIMWQAISLSNYQAINNLGINLDFQVFKNRILKLTRYLN